MACETTVIRTNYTDEEVQHEKTGFLFDKYDGERFQIYVLELLRSEKLRERFGKASRNFIEDRYSWDRVTEIFERECFELTK
jgi:glycosyltransferase involved in cell wall biosynthesis